MNEVNTNRHRDGNGNDGCPVRASGRDSRNGVPAPRTVTATSDQVVSESSGQSNGLWSGILSWVSFGGVGDVAVKREKQSSDVRGSGGSGMEGERVVRYAVNRSDTPSSVQQTNQEATESSGCPVKHDGNAQSRKGSTEPAFNFRNNEFAYGQSRAPEQAIPLSTTRQTSSIPKGEFNPSHQPEKEGDKWVYPSEQQYFNAIKRKGHRADAADMPTTLAIHNAVNEKGWAMVTEWERLRAGRDDAPPPKLLRFEGRPQNMSPKACVKTYLLGYQAPFDRVCHMRPRMKGVEDLTEAGPGDVDHTPAYAKEHTLSNELFAVLDKRHDWVVQRPDGSTARYVIDFYSGHINPGSKVPVALHLDVRPALDSVDAVVDRTRMFLLKEVRSRFSGVFGAFKSGMEAGSVAASSDATSREDAPPPTPSATSGR